MADKPHSWLSAVAVVNSARCSLIEFPDIRATVDMAWWQIPGGSWEAQQLVKVVMNLVVSLRRARDASSGTIYWQDPEVYHSSNVRRKNADNRVHRRSAVGAGSASVRSRRRANDRDRRRPGVSDSSAGTHGGNARCDGPGGKETRGRGRHSSNEGAQRASKPPTERRSRNQQLQLLHGQQQALHRPRGHWQERQKAIGPFFG